MIKKIFIILAIISLSNCSTKPKTIFICGDRACVNKDEAEQYFERNLSIEVKVLNNKKKEDIDLVQLNLKKDDNKRKISLEKKDKSEKKLKVLSRNEVKKIKSNLKKKNRISDKKTIKKNKDIVKKKKKSSIVKTKKVDDICTILEKCSIEEISNYLIKEGKNKKFPDITLRN